MSVEVLPGSDRKGFGGAFKNLRMLILSIFQTGGIVSHAHFLRHFGRPQGTRVIGDQLGGPDPAVVAAAVGGVGHGQLFQVADAAGAPAALPGPVQRRQQYRRQDGDNRYNHQQFDQGEFPGAHPRPDMRRRMMKSHGTILSLFVVRSEEDPFFFALLNRCNTNVSRRGKKSKSF